MARKHLRIDCDVDLRADVERYYAAHPFGPAALRHPQLAFDHGRYVAYTRRSIKGGVLGFGTSVCSALRAFDELYARTPWGRKRRPRPRPQPWPL
jgi:hypothetical protein